MKVKLNPDQKTVATIQEGLKQNNGYCPCKIEKTEDTKCMCKEFREQIKDPNYEGFCHCMLYIKEK
jgi:ferredoxin-thioredoxin reductase catalytic subunit